MIDDLKPGEAMLMGGNRCGTCCHLIGAHIWDSSGKKALRHVAHDRQCTVEGCTCTLQPLGPITLSEHNTIEFLKSRG